MELKSSKLSELTELVEFSKKNKLLKIEFNGIKVELHPSSFQNVDTKDINQMKEILKEELRHEILEESQKQLSKEYEETLYYSAR